MLKPDSIKDSSEMVSNTVSNMDFLDSPIILKILIPIFILILGWILRNLYDKYFAIKPRLYLKLGRPLYSQRFLGYDIGHSLTWPFECKLKNNSKFDAYNIEVFELEPTKGNTKIISNRTEIERKFPENNHLESNKSIEFELKKTIETPPETLLKFERRENDILVIPGIKIDRPQETLKPKELDNIRLVIKYENEKGKKIYTSFSRIKGKERNEIKKLRPYLFRKLVK